MTPAERFWSKVDQRGPDDCWPWLGWRMHQDYGMFDLTSHHKVRSHRYAYFLAHGHWPVVGRHICDNPPCCNPAHVIDGTHLDNERDKIERGRQAKGEGHGCARLTAEQVVRIRGDDRSQRVIAAEYKVSQTLVSAIKRRAAWGHLDD